MTAFPDIQHSWMPLFTEKGITFWWCANCGILKTGPHSEPGAYNFYQYGIPGKQYEEGRVDPPCRRF